MVVLGGMLFTFGLDAALCNRLKIDKSTDVEIAELTNEPYGFKNSEGNKLDSIKILCITKREKTDVNKTK